MCAKICSRVTPSPCGTYQTIVAIVERHSQSDCECRSSRTLRYTLLLQAGNDQRVGILGQTRMGKTFLAEHLLSQQPRVIVVDSKGHLNWSSYHLTNDPVAAMLTDRVIYRPPDGRPPNDFWTSAVESLHERGGGLIYIDEMSFISGSNQIDRALADGFRLGGERGVGIWYSAQESVSVHNTVLRQAEMLIMFYNQGASDRDKLARIVGDMGYTTQYLDKYQFIVFVRGETYDHDAIPTYEIVP
jgi:hypothetical protein